MTTKPINKSDKVILHLTLSGEEARILRDELYCCMSEMTPEDGMDMFEDRAGNPKAYPSTEFGDWVDDLRRKAYIKATIPTCEKLYLALRCALRQTRVMPTLRGPYT